MKCRGVYWKAFYQKQKSKGFCDPLERFMLLLYSHITKGATHGVKNPAKQIFKEMEKKV